MHIFWRKNLFLVLPIFVVFTIFFFASVNAAFNPEINYQGKLYGFDDRPVLDANYQMRFELFTELEGGAAIWTEDRTTTPNLVPLRNGLFSVMLGEVENLSGVDFNQPLYLQVSVGTSSLEVMSPRKKLGAVPAAFTSAKLDGKTWEAPGAIGTETATTAIFTNITSTGASFTKSIGLEETTASDVGVFYKGGSRFIHDYADEGSNGGNLFIGKNAGNFTMADSVGTYQASYNLGIGAYSLDALTTGYDNMAIGYDALGSLTAGSYNVGIGFQSLSLNTSGSWNTAIGTRSMQEATGAYNTGIGRGALYYTTGQYNLAAGYDAGKFTSDGVSSMTSGNYNILLGYKARVNASGDDNSIVIGNDVVGLGDNTVVIGSSSIQTTALRGNVGIGTTTPAYKLSVDGDINITGTYLVDGNDYGQYFPYLITTAGDAGQLWQSNGGGSGQWTNTSSLGILGRLPSGSIGQILVNNGGENWVTSSVIYVNTSTGNVGIGLDGSDILDRLTVGGGNISLYDPNDDYKLVLSNSNILGALSFVDKPTGNTKSEIIFDDKDIYINTSGSTRMSIKSNGNIGIGATNPQGKLSIISNYGYDIYDDNSFNSVPTLLISDVSSTVQNGQALLRLNSSNGNLASDFNLDVFLRTADDGSPRVGILTNGPLDNPGGNFEIGSLTNGIDLNFITSNTTRMSIRDGGNIGIGTINPLAKLSLDNDGAILAMGSLYSGSGWNGGTLNTGTRLMWIPEKAAFRAGYIEGDGWNSGNIGNYSSVGGGYNNISSGQASFVGGGLNNKATGNWSAVVGGAKNSSSNWFSFVGGGDSNIASGEYSFVGGGAGNTAFGNYSSAFGRNATVNGNYSMGISLTSTAFTLTNANTMAIMGGNVGIGTVSPVSLLEVAASNSTTGEITITGGGAFSTGATGEEIAALQFRSYDESINYPNQIAGRIVSVFEATNGSYAGLAFETHHQEATPANSLTEKMRITHSGRVGIGTTNPSALLHITSSAGDNELIVEADSDNNNENDNPRISVLQDGGATVGYFGLEGDTDTYNSSLTNALYIQTQGSSDIQFVTGGTVGSTFGTARMTITDAGYVGIAMTNPSVALDVTGSIEYTGTITDVSDERLKENIQPIENALEKIMQLNGVTFNMIGETSTNLGFLAQNVQTVFPSAVHIIDPDNDYLGLDYIALIAPTIKAIQEQQAQIDILREASSSTTLSVQEFDSQIIYPSGDLDLFDYSLLGVKNIVGSDNKWEIDINGTLINKIITSQGTEKKLYGMISENIEITFNGEGRLQSGEARIVFSEDVQEMIDESQSIKVNVTLTSLDTSNNVAVINKDKTGFTVKELNDGISNATFDWFVVAKRKMVDSFLEEIAVEEPIETIATAEDSLVDVLPTSPEEENLEPEPSMLEEPIETIATAEDSLVDVIPTSPEEENLEPEPSIPEEPIEITNISE